MDDSSLPVVPLAFRGSCIEFRWSGPRVLRGIERGRRFSPILQSMTPDSELRARLALSFLAAPGDTVLVAALRTRSADEVLAAVTGADSDGAAMLASARGRRTPMALPGPIRTPSA
jgi:hypothetical protein